MSFSIIPHSFKNFIARKFSDIGSNLDPSYFPDAGKLFSNLERIMMRHYDAASTDRLRNDWGYTTDSPYNDIQGDLKRLIARSRSTADNTGLSANIDNVFNSNVIHTGIKPEPMVKEGPEEINESANEILSEGWKRVNDQWDRSCKGTYYDNQRLSFTTIINSGSVLVNTVRSKKGSYLPVAWQTIEPDRLDWTRDTFNTRHEDASPKVKTQFGMKLDEYGCPIEFYLNGIDKPFQAGNMTIRYLRKRSEQFIGVPWKAPVLRHLWDLSNLVEDTSISWRIRAMISMWIDRQDAPTLLNPARVDTSNRLKWEPGRMMYSKTKPEVIESSQNVTDTFDPFTRLIQRSIAIGTGLSYQILTKDLHGMNFASSRANTLEDRRIFRMFQSWFIKDFCQRDWNNYVFWMFASGKMAPLTITDFNADPWKWTQAYWQPPGWQWVDPLKDSKASIGLHENNMLTLQDHYGSQGKNWRAELKQIAIEKQYIQDLESEYGVSLATAEQSKALEEEEGTKQEETEDRLSDLEDRL